MASAITIIFTSIPANADFNWENNITINTSDMVWEYTEQYTEENFTTYKFYIDSYAGNNDGYVSAWELLNMDSITRKAFYDSVISNMDVRINGSSGGVHLQEIDSSLSDGLLGRIDKRGEATNHYKITYFFDGSLTELGANIWFLAEPESNMTIMFPVGIDITSIGGIDNTTISVYNATTTLIGIVGFEGEIIIGYAENTTWILSALEPEEYLTSIQDVEAETELSELQESYDLFYKMPNKLRLRQKL